jgi:hypothetical protein
MSHRHPRNYSWAELMERVLEIDVLKYKWGLFFLSADLFAGFQQIFEDAFLRWGSRCLQPVAWLAEILFYKYSRKKRKGDYLLSRLAACDIMVSQQSFH